MATRANASGSPTRTAADKPDPLAIVEEKTAATAARDEERSPPVKITPLPMAQMASLLLIFANESICSSMLIPFVGLLVAHLKGVSVNEAGYDSGMLIGVFMLGQVISAKMWGWVSDQYGRRFPIISGLFTSGLMMLGFGLSTNVWMCVIFRFLHGLFNGNILVAKTMMADITDKTNAAKGFASVNLGFGMGMLVGPTLGGILYDPAHSSALRWAHISEDSPFGRLPALLPSLAIFIFTNVGMLVSIFCIKESNPNARPLPGYVKYLFPCFWRAPRMFVPHRGQSVEPSEKGIAPHPSTSTVRPPSGASEDDDDGGTTAILETAERMVRNVSISCGVAPIVAASPVLREDPRFDAVVICETLDGAIEHATPFTPRYGQEHPSLSHAQTKGAEEAPDAPHPTEASDWHAHACMTSGRHNSATAESSVTTREGNDVISRKPTDDVSDENGCSIVVVEAESQRGGSSRIVSKSSQHTDDEGEVVLTRFGYKQAFERPVTRTMLVVYMLMGAADVMMVEVYPLWAIASVCNGGLGFGADKVGYIVLTNSVPCIVSNLLFHRACAHYPNKLVLFRISVTCCGLAATLLPFISYLSLGSFVLPAVILFTGTRQFFASWGYGIVNMLTAYSAPPAHVGAIMGINQSCACLVRSIVPFLVTPLFAWSITHRNPLPFNHVFSFLISTLVFAAAMVYSTALTTDADNTLSMADRDQKWTVQVILYLAHWRRRLCGSDRRRIV